MTAEGPTGGGTPSDASTRAPAGGIPSGASFRAPAGGTPSGASTRAEGQSPFDRRVVPLVRKVTGTVLGPYQTAVVRIGFAATWLFFLLREYPHRHELYGPDGPWGWDLAERLITDNRSFTVLLWTDSALWFEAVYALAVIGAALLLVGWRTRASSVLFMVGVLSLQNRSVFMGDGGDNVIHIMAVYLTLTRCGQVWSLDARRRARAAGREGGASDVVGPVLWSLLGLGLVAATLHRQVTGEGWFLGFLWLLWVAQGVWWLVCRFAPGQPRTLLDVIGNAVHNATLGVIMAEVCLIYATAGWYKIQGSRWQDGTALYYPLKLDYFSPWPALSDLLAHGSLVVMIITYGTVIVQVAFPFTLLNRRVKNVLLTVMIAEHAGIAVLLGLPFFSLAMITADAVFLPTVFLLWTEGRVLRAGRRLRRAGRDRLRRSRSDSDSGSHGPGGGGSADAAGASVPGQRPGSGDAAGRTLVG
ncbi:hypothetical protein BJP40_26725 [Streptomyces sp. CC53]|nr:hypothetical protein BJP40_26725 [Streptomyces sp. CC53]